MTFGTKSWSSRTYSRTTIPRGSRFSNRLDWELRMSLPEPSSTNGRWLLLSDLLIGIAPRADLQSPADPAKLFGRIRRTWGAAHRTLLHALDLVGCNGAL